MVLADALEFDLEGVCFCNQAGDPFSARGLIRWPFCGLPWLPLYERAEYLRLLGGDRLAAGAYTSRPQRIRTAQPQRVHDAVGRPPHLYRTSSFLSARLSRALCPTTSCGPFARSPADADAASPSVRRTNWRDSPALGTLAGQNSQRKVFAGKVDVRPPGRALSGCGYRHHSSPSNLRAVADTNRNPSIPTTRGIVLHARRTERLARANRATGT